GGSPPREASWVTTTGSWTRLSPARCAAGTWPTDPPEKGTSVRLIDNLRNRSDRNRRGDAEAEAGASSALPLRWADLAVDTCADHPAMLADIAARRFDGITVS